MNIEHARFNMIEQQIRPWGVLASSVLSALEEVPREAFVPPEFRHLAFADIEIPIGHGQTMMEPKLGARLFQALAPQPGEKILEIGTGSGYVTALLAHAGATITTVEIYPELLESAAAALGVLGVDNVSLEAGDASTGWPKGDAWDGILLTASVPQLPAAFAESVAPEGRIIAVIGKAPAMEAVRIERDGAGSLLTTSLFDAQLPPMVNAPDPHVFQL